MNIIEGIQAECARCRELLKVYEGIGPVGSFGRLMISRDIENGEAAIASGDIVAMVEALRALQGCK